MTKYLTLDIGKIRIDKKCEITRKTLKDLIKKRNRLAMYNFRNMFAE